MSYYDSDLKAILARFHNHTDTDRHKDILKKLSDNQLSRVVIQGVRYKFERQELEDIALVMLHTISSDPCLNLMHDVNGENEVVVKDGEANGEIEVMIKMEQELDDDDGAIMKASERKTIPGSVNDSIGVHQFKHQFKRQTKPAAAKTPQ
ncbi:hypothetical protein J4E91_009300 [Alternaria rosae]|nr:hypothetical protein J4E91_009300 [Alternaria rosae]